MQTPSEGLRVENEKEREEREERKGEAGRKEKERGGCFAVCVCVHLIQILFIVLCL